MILEATVDDPGLDMYTTEVTGHYRFVQNGHAPPCTCQRCVHFDYGHHGGFQAARQTDHPAPDQARWDAPNLWAKDPGRTEFVVERSVHRSPQRRPVFVGTVPCGRADLSPVCSWEMPPSHCKCPVRHCPPAREQCGCVVVRSDARPVCSGIPHPLPHLQVKGQGYRPRRTVRYVSVDEEDCSSEGCHFEPHSPQMGHLPNGHCGPGASVEERDKHQGRGRTLGGSEQGCNGHGGFYRGFFSTEVPLKHFEPNRRKGPCVSSSGGTQTLKSNGPIRTPDPSPETVEHKTKQDSVREQIRQVVSDLEGVLGGLKQVHVEMREVVEQIDRLTANIDLNEETPSITQGPSPNNSSLSFTEDLRVAPVNNNNRPGPTHTPQQIDEDRIILRTNSPSPVHMASVVKTNRIAPSRNKNGLNGHPPQLYPMNHTGHTLVQQEPHPQALDPKVIIENRTQKPPPYPQNGRCGKYPPPVKPARTPPAHSGRGRQSSSVV